MAKKSKITVKEALRLNIDDMLNMKRKDLEAAYSKLRKTTASRVQTYYRNAAGRAQAIKKVKNLRTSPAGFKNKREIARAMFQMQLFLGGDESTYAEHERKMKEFRDLMSDRTGITFKTEAHPEMSAAYAEIVELYKEVTRLGGDMAELTFRDNINYWLKNKDTLKNAPAGRGRRTASRLMKDLKLPKIREDKED